MPREHLRGCAVEWHCEHDDAQDLAPTADSLQHRCLTPRRSRRARARPKRETCLVQEGNDEPASPSRLFTAYQSCRGQARMTASLRSVARVAGGCGDPPRALSRGRANRDDPSRAVRARAHGDTAQRPALRIKAVRSGAAAQDSEERLPVALRHLRRAPRGACGGAGHRAPRWTGAPPSDSPRPASPRPAAPPRPARAAPPGAAARPPCAALLAEPPSSPSRTTPHHLHRAEHYAYVDRISQSSLARRRRVGPFAAYHGATAQIPACTSCVGA